MATDGVRTLLIWLELENDGRSYFIGGLVIDPFGNVIEGSRFKYSEQRHRNRSYVIQNNMEVVWAGDHFLMAWTEYIPQDGGEDFAWALRVSRDGVLLDSEAMRLSAFRPPASESFAFSFEGLKLASNGKKSLAVFGQNNILKEGKRISGTGSIQGVEIYKDGTVSEPVLIHPFEESAASSRVQHKITDLHHNGESFLLVTSDLLKDPNPLSLTGIPDDLTQTDWEKVVFWKGGEAHTLLYGIDTFISSSHESTALLWSDRSLWPHTQIHTSFSPNDLPESEVANILIDEGWVGAHSLSSNGRDFYALCWLRFDEPPRELLGRVLSPNGDQPDADFYTIAYGHRVFGQVSGNDWGYVIAYVSHDEERRDYTYHMRLLADKQHYMFLQEPKLREGGGIQFQFIGLPGESYVIESSHDLNTWSEVEKVQNYDGPTLVNDAGSNSMRFYRSRHLP